MYVCACVCVCVRTERCSGGGLVASRFPTALVPLTFSVMLLVPSLAVFSKISSPMFLHGRMLCHWQSACETIDKK